MMRAVITKKIVDVNRFGEECFIGYYVYFTLNRNNKSYKCCGRIKDIENEWFSIEDVRIDDMNVSDVLIIKYEEVQDGVLSGF